MRVKRTDRLNSLLREVIAEVVQRQVKNPDVHQHTSITRVEITKDLRQAKVYVSILGSEQERTTTLQALSKAAGFISSQAAQKVVMRYFPKLTFHLDETVDRQMEIEKRIMEIEKERQHREQSD